MDAAVEISAKADEFEAATGCSHDTFIDMETGELTGELGENELEKLIEDERFLQVAGYEMQVDGYQTMEKFVRQIADANLREQLLKAISGRSAFRRFKDIVFDCDDKKLCESWNQFEIDEAKEAYRIWFEEHGIFPEWSCKNGG